MKVSKSGSTTGVMWLARNWMMSMRWGFRVGGAIFPVVLADAVVGSAMVWMEERNIVFRVIRLGKM